MLPSLQEITPLPLSRVFIHPELCPPLSLTVYQSSADEAEVGSPGDIVKITTYVTSINDWRASALEQQSLFNEYFKGEYPANNLVEITALAEPEDRVGPR